MYLTMMYINLFYQIKPIWSAHISHMILIWQFPHYHYVTCDLGFAVLAEKTISLFPCGIQQHFQDFQAFTFLRKEDKTA